MGLCRNFALKKKKKTFLGHKFIVQLLNPGIRRKGQIEPSFYFFEPAYLNYLVLVQI